MKILVTGANGYLGQGIVKSLLDKGCCIVATDLQDDFIDKRAIIKKCDLFNLEEPFEYFDKPDILLHLAWRDGFKHGSMAHIKDLPKHFEFIKKMIDSGISKFCGLGSMHEVGYFEGCIDEKTPTNPLSLYGISKNSLRQAVELLVKEKEIHYCWIRGFYIVGNEERGCSIFSKITAAEKQKQLEFPFTSGDNKYDFLDYEEFCEQVSLVVMQDKYGGVINCCSGRPVRLGDRVEQYIRNHKYNIKLKYNEFPDRPYDSKAIWGDNKIIEKIKDDARNSKSKK